MSRAREPTDRPRPASGASARPPGASARALSAYLTGRRGATWVLRSLTAVMRPLPDFLVLGGMRCGTTSLYRSLERHPCVVGAWGKESWFFETHYHRGPLWYRRYFPTQAFREALGLVGRRPVITGEASPSNLFFPRVPERVAGLLPQARFVVLLRNPVDRAYSHYQHSVRRRGERRSFDEAVDGCERAWEIERARAERDPDWCNHDELSTRAYLTRGIYVEQLRRWLRHFERERFLILQSERLYAEPERTLARVHRFLELPATGGRTHPPIHAERGAYASLEPASRRRLSAFFAPHNDALYDLLGEDYGWE